MKYEYKTVAPELSGFFKKTPAKNIDAELNELGAEGWELVSVVTTTANGITGYGASTSGVLYYFKRELI